MGKPISYDNFLRVHDEAIDAFIGRLRVDYGTVSGVSRPDHPILRAFAAPDRAYAAIVERLVSLGWISGSTVSQMRDNAGDFAVLPLPFATIERGRPVPYLEASGVPKTWRTGQFNQATQEFEHHQWPGMYRIEYRVNFWSLKRYTEAWLTEFLAAQFGRIGAGESEVFLQITHPDPFGTLRQALHFDSDADLSVLEGDDSQRFIRWEVAFTLNAVFLRAPLVPPAEIAGPGGGLPYLDQVVPATAELAESTVTDSLDAPGTDASIAIGAQSHNLYRPYTFPSNVSQWPVAGDALVEISRVTPDGRRDLGALRIEVDDPADQVDVTNRPVALDADDVAILSVSFQYLSDAAVGLDVYSNPGTHVPPAAPAWLSALQDALPARPRWTKVQRFTLVTQPIMDVSLRGRGAAAVARFARIDVRHLRSPVTKLAPTTTTPGVGDVTYDWTGLNVRQPYLLVVVLTPTGASDTLTAQDDLTSPVFTKTETVDDNVNQGAVILLQPQADALRLVVPDTLTVAQVYAQEYHGVFAGHEL